MKEDYFKNEEEKSFVQRECNKLTCATYLVESLMRVNAEYPHSDNDFDYDNCRNILETVIYEHEDAVEVIKDVLEWWIVDTWMYNKLNEIDQVTLAANGLYFWGRTCSGQSIELDGTFQTIYQNIQDAVSVDNKKP